MYRVKAVRLVCALVVLLLQPIGIVIFAEGEAGPDRALVAPGSTVLSATLPPGWTAQWVQIGGQPAALGSSTSATTSVTATQAGRRRFRLLAQGPGGANLQDEVEVFAFGSAGNATSTGGEHLWHEVELTFDYGATLYENGFPNPFLDLRLDVTYWHEGSGELLTVPGFFAADGNAADTSAASGRYFRARLTPSRAGTWRYLTSGRSGVEVAVADNALSGAANALNSLSGTFQVGALDPEAPGNLTRGVLRYVGAHHLCFEGTHERFIKTGADSPENILGYHEFDQTWNLGGSWEGNLPNGLHSFSAHVSDFAASDPMAQAATWAGGKGAGILGALDYLASRGVNSIYFLTYNVDGGDGQDTWPWRTPAERFRFDVSKLEQWERVFGYADARGIQLHFVLQETENDTALGGLSTARKVYFRELIGRFAHHLALQWNLGEENHNTVADRTAFAEFFERHDAYAHPVTFHTDYGSVWSVYDPHHGNPGFDATSIQGDAELYHGHAKLHRELSANAGRPWAIYGDEQGPPVDAAMGNLDHLRKTALWGNLIGGGAGVEWYFGYQSAIFGDIQLDDFSLAEPLWDMSARARDFMETYVSVERLAPNEWLTPESDDYVLADPGHTYVVYRRNGGAALLDLAAETAPFQVRWFDPKVGGPPVIGSVPVISGPGYVSIGTPPFAGDAVAWITGGVNRAPAIIEAGASLTSIPQGGDLVLHVLADDPDGPSQVTVAGVFVNGPAGGYLGSFVLDERQGRRHAQRFENLTLPPGMYTLVPIVQDQFGAFALGTSFQVESLP